MLRCPNIITAASNFSQKNTENVFKRNKLISYSKGKKINNLVVYTLKLKL